MKYNDEAVAFSLANFILKCVKSEKQETRLVDKILIDYVLKLAIDIAVRYDIPIQYHTGIMIHESYVSNKLFIHFIYLPN